MFSLLTSILANLFLMPSLISGMVYSYFSNNAVLFLFLRSYSANATGVYSGITAGGNGDSSDASNLVRRILSYYQGYFDIKFSP
jgi:protocatechuate 3,4-dioxygenase beta subunit